MKKEIEINDKMVTIEYPDYGAWCKENLFKLIAENKSVIDKKKIDKYFDEKEYQNEYLGNCYNTHSILEDIGYDGYHSNSSLESYIWNDWDDVILLKLEELNSELDIDSFDLDMLHYDGEPTEYFEQAIKDTSIEELKKFIIMLFEGEGTK